MHNYPDEVMEHFWAQVDRSGGPDACWNWTGTVRADGYGVFNLGMRLELAHRLALVLSGVDIPPGSIAMQICGNRLCCHADTHHLRVGTRSEQMTTRSRTRRVPRPEVKREPDET
jgi:hypothetical protein